MPTNFQLRSSNNFREIFGRTEDRGTQLIIIYTDDVDKKINISFHFTHTVPKSTKFPFVFNIQLF